MKNVLLSIVVTLATIGAKADVRAAYESLHEIRMGLNQGLYQSMDPAQRSRFERALGDARDILLSSTSSAPAFVCAGASNGNFIVTDANTGKTFGQPVYPISLCQQTMPKPGATYTCFAASNGNFQITNIITGQTLGVPIYPLTTCQNLIPSPGYNFACVPASNGNFQAINLLTGSEIGQPVYPLSLCKSSLP